MTLNKKKIFVFLPDGVGFRNFALSGFKEEGDKQGADIWYWNNTSFPLAEDLGLQEIRMETKPTTGLLGAYSRARKHIELNQWTKQFSDNVYQTYKFPFATNGLRNRALTAITCSLIGLYDSKKGAVQIREKIKKLAKQSPTYAHALEQLKTEGPDFVFCTSQRATQAIAPLMAAQDLNIPTATFIYSWDNVPKAMLVVETDYYFVWSKLMKEELLKYYDFIKPEQVFITGTPQFEPHYDTSLLTSRAEFCETHGLDENKNYICFSGDDETTSPLDQYYLEDLALAVKALNDEGYNLGIIFRKAPVDFTGRYESVLQQYPEIITAIDPLWEQKGDMWNTVYPTKADFALLSNVCEHSVFVANICSSTVFDFAIHNKPCLYFNYEQPQLKPGIRDIGQNYNYVHFRSMPNQEAVVWALNKEELKDKVKALIDEKLNPLPHTHIWFNTVVGEWPTEASRRIWEVVKKNVK